MFGQQWVVTVAVFVCLLRSQPFSIIQASNFILRCLSRYYCRRGGRKLQEAPSSVKDAARIVRAKKTIFKRPRQHGWPGWTFVAAKRRQHPDRSKAELMNEFRNLDDASKEYWTQRHLLQVRMRKRADSEAAARKQAEDDEKRARFTSTWHVGDSEHLSLQPCSCGVD